MIIPSTSSVIVLLLHVFQCPLLSVLGIPVDKLCPIILDDVDKIHRRFVYYTPSDRVLVRCTYCSAITRAWSDEYLKAKEEQCEKKNENIDLKFDLIPNCRNMEHITCVIPFLIENGEWICGCIGLPFNISHQEVMVHSNCTQQCKPGYDLVGDSNGHCGERLQRDKNFPTEFRHGNAKCVKKESADHDQSLLVPVIIAVVLVVLAAALVFCCCCCHRLPDCCCHKKKTGRSAVDRTNTSILYCNEPGDCSSSSVTVSSMPGTQLTNSTKVTRMEEEGKPLLPGNEGATGTVEANPPLRSKENATGSSTDELTESNKEKVAESEKGCIQIERIIESINLPSFEGPISGLSQFPENTAIAGGKCKVHLDNLFLVHGTDLGAELRVLNETGKNGKRKCHNMAIDIIKCVFSNFDERRVNIEAQLNFLCDKDNPVMAVLFEVLKNFDCQIGHVVAWCVENGHGFLVQYIVSEEHERKCLYCCNMKRKYGKKGDNSTCE